ncbi:hypothetical protein A5886_001454 [Enterococcus sp. 8G7_MSG3316]|uniref:Uncharacterized protein n=1 Tax=Candidatus Enterococcus testudinis TaxID=1834191 RepID=A0A242A5R1_9ENTE|nr:hypothetical protein [Enterococcus sp. 8G7_MSG3316]OTN76377.1 hypothetical protein A5886_001454 [Enterococcus sp. 8G7_MSG3316]
MSIEKEKRMLYDLMREIIEERRMLTKLYFELKEHIKKMNTPINTEDCDRNDQIIEKEKTISTLKKEKKFKRLIILEKTGQHITCLLKELHPVLYLS